MSLVVLALPQDTLRMKTMAEKEENPPLGDDPVAISAKGKAKKDKHKHKEAKGPSTDLDSGHLHRYPGV